MHIYNNNHCAKDFDYPKKINYWHKNQSKTHIYHTPLSKSSSFKKKFYTNLFPNQFETFNNICCQYCQH